MMNTTNPTREDIETTIKTLEKMQEHIKKPSVRTDYGFINQIQSVKDWLCLWGDKIAICPGQCPDWTPKKDLPAAPPEPPKPVKALIVDITNDFAQAHGLPKPLA